VPTTGSASTGATAPAQAAGVRDVQGNADSRYDERATAGGQTSAGPAASSSPQMRAPSLSPPRMASIRSLGCATSSREAAAAACIDGAVRAQAVKKTKSEISLQPPLYL
jgi:hypothetical protein